MLCELSLSAGCPLLHGNNSKSTDAAINSHIYEGDESVMQSPLAKVGSSICAVDVCPESSSSVSENVEEASSAILDVAACTEAFSVRKTQSHRSEDVVVMSCASATRAINEELLVHHRPDLPASMASMADTDAVVTSCDEPLSLTPPNLHVECKPSTSNAVADRSTSAAELSGTFPSSDDVKSVDVSLKTSAISPAVLFLSKDGVPESDSDSEIRSSQQPHRLTSRPSSERSTVSTAYNGDVEEGEDEELVTSESDHVSVKSSSLLASSFSATPVDEDCSFLGFRQRVSGSRTSSTERQGLSKVAASRPPDGGEREKSDDATSSTCLSFEEQQVRLMNSSCRLLVELWCDVSLPCICNSIQVLITL